MIEKNKVIAKIMVLVLCANTLPCISAFAVEKSTNTVNTNIISEENATEVTTGSAINVKDSVSNKKDLEFNEATGTITKSDITKKEIEEKKPSRKFKKKWMTAIFCGDLFPDYAKGKEKVFQNITGFKTEDRKLEEIDNQLESSKSHYADSVTISIHIDLNPITKKIVIGEDLDQIQKVFDEAKEKNVAVEMIKIHYQSPWDGTRIASLSKNEDSFIEFFDEYMSAIKTIAEKFKGQTKKFVLFNEFGLAYRTNCWKDNHIAYKDYSDKIVEMINETRAIGYEVGISTCDVDDAKNIPEVVINALDFLGVNWYPSSTCLTYDEYVKDIKDKYKDDLKWFEDFKTKHSKKQLYITETGVEDYEGSVKKSNIHYEPKTDELQSDGKYQCMNIRMLYEIFKDSKVDGICYWWFLWGYMTSTKELCKEYFE